MKKSIDLNMFLSFQWEDNRLEFDPNSFDLVTLPDEFSDTLWKPYIQAHGINQFEIISALQEWQTMYISNESVVTYGVNAHVNFRCYMNFDYFPMDVNICPFEMWIVDDEVDLYLSHINANQTDSFKNEPFQIEIGITNGVFAEASFSLKMKININKQKREG